MGVLQDNLKVYNDGLWYDEESGSQPMYSRRNFVGQVAGGLAGTLAAPGRVLGLGVKWGPDGKHGE